MMDSKDPLGYVFHVLSNVAVMNPNALEVEKTNRLIEELRCALKV